MMTTRSIVCIFAAAKASGMHSGEIVIAAQRRSNLILRAVDVTLGYHSGNGDNQQSYDSFCKS